MKDNPSFAHLCLFCKNLVEIKEKISSRDFEHGTNNQHSYKYDGNYFKKRRICMITGQDVYDVKIISCSEHRDSREEDQKH